MFNEIMLEELLVEENVYQRFNGLVEPLSVKKNGNRIVRRFLLKTDSGVAIVTINSLKIGELKFDDSYEIEYFYSNATKHKEYVSASYKVNLDGNED